MLYFGALKIDFGNRKVDLVLAERNACRPLSCRRHRRWRSYDAGKRDLENQECRRFARSCRRTFRPLSNSCCQRLGNQISLADLPACRADDLLDRRALRDDAKANQPPDGRLSDPGFARESRSAGAAQGKIFGQVHGGYCAETAHFGQ